MAGDPHYLDKRDVHDAEMLAWETVLASGLKPFLAELVTIDGTVMMGLVCKEQHANLDDIIGSSMEQCLKPGCLSYANRAEVDFDWGKVPSVALGMELRDRELTAFFEVVLAGDHVGISIQGVHFSGRAGSPEENLRRIVAAVAAAQMPPPTETRRAG